MKKINIDVTLSADQTLSFNTDTGEYVTLRFCYNVRSAFWYLDIQVGALVLNGLKIVPGYPLLQEQRSHLPIPGDFILLPVTADARNYPRTYEDFGKTWFLFYMSAEEAASWRAYRGLR